MTILLILVLLAAGAGIVAYAASSNEKQVQVRDVVRDNAKDTVDAMKQLVEDNTR
jgi:hypothetical protein